MNKMINWIREQNIFIKSIILIVLIILSALFIGEVTSSTTNSVEGAYNLQWAWFLTTLVSTFYASIILKKEK